jgi:hypothetical protein
VIQLDESLISEILVPPLPDLKASDMLYFCIARHGKLKLVTEDRRLRSASLNGGVRAFSPESALAIYAARKACGPAKSTRLKDLARLFLAIE